MATVVIKNSKYLTNNLINIFEPRVSAALKMTQDEIFKVIQEHITSYYHEMTPLMYSRTWKFLNSLIKTEIVKSGNTFSCSVEIDKDYLYYRYSGGATGLEVATYANEHSHGGVYDDDFGSFWDDAITELGLEPGILYIMKKNLQKCGVPVK